MNEEIKEILDNIKNKYKDYYVQDIVSGDDLKLLSDYITNLQHDIENYVKITLHDRKEIDRLQQENEHLKTLVNSYENPDDLTLFYMWLNEKAKDKMKHLQQENEILRKNAEHNDKVVDKARWNEMIYKSRCKKAIEILKLCNSKCAKETINILQGSDEK